MEEKNIPIDTSTEMQVVIKSKMFSLDAIFIIAFHFSGEKLTSITISPDTAIEGKALYFRYVKIQKALENELGRPHNRSWLIMDLLNPNYRLARWQGNGFKIEHYLLDRFGMEEIIDINLN